MKSLRHHERGATLIVVLIILLLVTILGTLAIRQGLVSLNISTNSQAQSLLTQSSDSALFALEDPTQLSTFNATNGMLGMLRAPGNQDKELVFCYRGDSAKFFDSDTAAFISWNSTSKPDNASLGTTGYCDNRVAGSFTSGRQATLTQVAVKVGSSSDKPFEFMQRGTEPKTAQVQPAQPISVYSTSLLPALSSADPDKVHSCLSEHMSGVVAIPDGVTVGAADADGIKTDDTVTDCLAKLKVPATTQVSEYRSAQDF